MKQNTTNAAAENMSDEAIIELYWQRQEKAIQATDQKYGKYLFTIAYNIVKNSMDCEECLNDTYRNMELYSSQKTARVPDLSFQNNALSGAHKIQEKRGGEAHTV